MAGVDDRVVNMQFDNAEFERKLSATLSSLDKLQSSLDFSNSRKGLDDLNDAGKRFDLSGIGTHIEGVSTKFLAMATIGITALTQIATRAVSAGAQFLNSFTFAPIMDGFHEMETAIGSTQTILANTARFGTQLPEVQANLAALNTYADKTIYNFGEMTHNLGLFTNAGIKVGDATSMIKGFSNAAAASGTTAEGAAGAAYQLSQALSAGQVRLMDWRSLTNVGMGNKNMQDSLIEIADKMGTVSKAGIKGSDIQKDFNGSLEKGWLSADVMSTYLRIMAGDMDSAKLSSMGFTAAQIKGFQDQQKMAEDAATKVRTITQLVGTVKEAVGSGWAQTFSIVLGGFDEATDLLTKVNNAIGNMVSGSANARNNLLQGWKDLGGRTLLIQAFSDAIKAVGEVLAPIKAAFRDVFPATTAQDLMKFTQEFAHLAKMMEPSPKTVADIRDIFRGLFSVLDIGKTIIVELVKFVGGLLGNLSGAGGGALDLAAKFGTMLQVLDNILVGEGGIHKFFVNLGEYIKYPINFIKELFGHFEHLSVSTAGVTESLKPMEAGLDRVSKRFDGLRQFAHILAEVFDEARDILSKAWEYISSWFSELGKRLAASMAPGDFNAAVDVMNVGLLGGIILMLHKFMTGLKDLDVSGGLFSKMSDALDSFTNKMKAVQTELKAKALMEIAIAVGVLTASIVVLSLIDSEALSKSMTALAVGFLQLVATMKMLDNIAGSAGGAAKLGLLAGSMILLATSAVILAGAVAVLGNLGVDTLAKGMGALTVALALMVGAIKALEGDTAGVLAASVAMVAIATSMTIMAGAVALFGQMSWETMAKGLVGVAAALGIIVIAMMLMPVASLLAAGLAMIPLAAGLAILAGVVLIFGTMSWEAMAKGLLALAGVLAIVAISMNAMPLTLPIIAFGMIELGKALAIMGAVVIGLGLMKFETLAKGIGALAAVLAILVVSMELMQSALLGAASMVIVAGALVLLAGVMKTLGQLSWSEILKGLVALAAVFVVLGLAGLALEPVIPALLGLGIAMTLVGAGFTLFGAGAWMIGKALQVLAETGVVAVKVLIQSLELLLKAIPMLIATLVVSIGQSAGDIFNAAQLLLKIITVLLGQILDTVIALAPKIGEALVAVITAAMILIRAKFPDVAQTALDLLITMLTTIRDNIGKVSQLGVDIIVNFANTMRDNADKLVNAAVDLLLAFLKAVSDRANDISAAGVNTLLAFLAGMINNIYRIADFAVSVIITLAETIANETTRLVTAAVDILIAFAQSLADNAYRAADKGVTIVIALMDAIGAEGVRLANGAADALIKFINGLSDAIDTKAPEIRAASVKLALAIINGITGGITENAGRVIGALTDLAGNAVDSFLHAIHAKSPSRDFMKAASYIPQGIALGISNDNSPVESVVAKAEEIIDAFSRTISRMPDSLEGLDASPVITPVLDLTKVKSAAGGISSLMGSPVITPGISYEQARTIATTTDIANPSGPEPAYSGPSEVKFEQNIYSPEALSTNDIYKGTRSQFALAKEELNIP